MSKIKRGMAASAFVMAAVVGGGIATGGSAQAALTGCHVTVAASTYTRTGGCTGGSGLQRAKHYCQTSISNGVYQYGSYINMSNDSNTLYTGACTSGAISGRTFQLAGG
jgi:hypothetical protein